MMNEKPCYDNLTKKGTLEWANSAELVAIARDLRTLSDATFAMNENFVSGLRKGYFESWKEVAEMINGFAESLKNGLDHLSAKL